MKKTITIFTAFLLAITVAFLSLNINRANADPETIKGTVANLLESYIDDGKYTKWTTLNTARISESEGVYHGSASTAKRRTYYDETVNALLMCNYDGTFGSTEHPGINSGYRTVGVDMYHCTYDVGENEERQDGSSLSDLSSNLIDGWSVTGTSVKDYYDVLSDLSETVENYTTDERWSVSNGVYTYTTNKDYLTTENNYNDRVLKEFQWFAAPMLVVKDSLQIKKAQISESYAYVGITYKKVLVIRILDASDKLISTCYVVPGLQVDEITIAEMYLEANIWVTAERSANGE